MQQLCVAKYAPSNWWDFINCQNFEGRDKIGQPELAVKCGAVININWNESKVGECAGQDGSGQGAEGIKLLQESIAETAKAGIT